jgi:hypothetical protein
MLPNFTVVICGAVLTVLMLAVAGSGLIEPEARTRVGAMPEIGRPMMQRMITEPARGQFAALEMSRRAEEVMRLRDLAPAIADPAPSAEHDEPNQPVSVAPALQPLLPSDATTAPATSTEAAPVVATETVPAAAGEGAAVTPAGPGPDPAPAPVAIAESTPPAAAEETPARDAAGASTPADAALASGPIESPPAAPPIAPPVAAPERVAADPVSEPPATAERSEPPAEPPPFASQQLALAEPDAVPAPEAPVKLAVRTGEPEEAPPVRRLVLHFVPRLPRTIPTLARLSSRGNASALPHAKPSSARRIHAKARLEGADIARAAAKKPVHHYVVRPVQHRAQRAAVAPNTEVSPYGVVGPYPAYGVTSGVQYK